MPNFNKKEAIEQHLSCWLIIPYEQLAKQEVSHEQWVSYFYLFIVYF